MPRGPLPWQTATPAEGVYTPSLPSLPDWPVRTFLPASYEPKYPYPLVVFFHGQGSNEDQILKLAPRLSRRNYVCIGLRGPQGTGLRADGRQGFGWGLDGEFDAFAEEYLVRAVEQTRRTYHCHSERIYLAGICEGSSLAYRLGLGMPDKVAGVISLNGTTPRPATSGPLFRLPDVRQLRVMIGHGIANSVVPLSLAKRDYRLLYAAGVDVSLATYPTTHRLHPDMLRDMNRWIMDTVCPEPEGDEDEVGLEN